MILTGEPIDAPAGLRWGLVDLVAASGGLDSAVEQVVAQALNGGEAAIQARRQRMIAGPGGAAAASMTLSR